ncbi:MAG TPA: RHS repeat-associated core domain-containing protein, partial [Flavobacterium sp.]|uniref:RHS repeat domain-containing protein n=1 Tax=Flavobacterium sp. TaxID=239 RepID=UPI002ED4A7DE
NEIRTSLNNTYLIYTIANNNQSYLYNFFGSENSIFTRDPGSAEFYYIKKGDVIVASFYLNSAFPNNISSFTSFTTSNNSPSHFRFNYNIGALTDTMEGEMELPFNNFDCPVAAQKCIPQPVAPVTCDNAKKTEYIEFVNGKSGVPPALSNYSIDAASVQFCENNYQYIFDSYKAYINQMKSIGLTSAHDIRFRTISEFGNTYLNYGFSDIGNAITQYSAYYVAHATDADLLNWNDWVNIEFRKTNTLCPPAPLSNTFTSPMPADEAKTCDHFSINIDGAFGNDIYNSVIEAKKQKFIKDYITQAMTAVETFDMNYTDKEYQYTLYYYDQAGNLTQTVAPEGVKRMTLDKAANDNINAYRTGNDPAENTALQPAHTFKTQYKYNTLNQLVWQKTPDGGETRFAYDKLGRIIASQNANQAKPASGSVRFSYTSYDGLGRITEAGEILNPNTTAATTYTINDEGKLVYGGAAIVDVFTANIASKTEVTKTVYSDDPGVENWTPTVPPGVTPPVLTRNASYFFSDKSTTPSLNNINRVTGVFYYDTYIEASPLNFNNAIFYNYDIHGNVKEVVNYYSALRNVNCISSSKNDCEAHIKRVVYDYDLISGNVNTVTFQPNKPDLFVHKYNYDADNRIVDVQTSSDNVIWEKEANYKYYLHGPLARVELGNKKVQGIDYAYTLQGWLKAVNGENLTAAANDMGQDGLASGTTKTFDAFGYSLNYYDKDYKSIGSTDETSGFKPLMYSRNSTIQPNSKDLFNGNIKQMTTAIRKTDGSLLNIQKNTYTYDQLNRIKAMTSSAIVPNATSGTTSYDSNYSYDKNGNLLTLNRKAPNSAGAPTDMDKLTYEYPNEVGQTYRNSNKLALVKDAAPIPAATFVGDLEDQVAKLAALTPAITYNINNPATHNYIYDEIGQLIEDKTEGILINWRVDGKVKNVVKGTVTYAFEYNGLGNRIAKKEIKPGLITTTYYAHDAQGNVLGVYEEKFKPKETDLQNDLLLNSYNVNSVALKRAINNIFMTSDGSTASVSANGNLKLQAGNSITLKNFTAVQGSTFVAQITPVQANNNESVLTLEEHHIFGSNRLGMETKSLVVYNSTNTSGTVDPVQTNFLSLIGDKHFELSNHLGNVLAVISDKKIPTATAGVFNPDVLSYSDYYPFGMLVPNRHVDSDKYRYGFQGQEMDNEIKGEGNSLNYTFRMHDPRVGRFFTTDPLTKEYPHYSPYSFSGNKVIASVEFEGLEDVWVADGSKIVKKVGPYVGAYTSYETANNRYLEFTARKPKMARPLAEIRSDNLEDQVNKYRGVNPGLAVSRGVIDGVGQTPGVVVPEILFAKAARLYQAYKIAKQSKMAAQAAKVIVETDNAVYQGAEFIDDGYRMIDAPLIVKNTPRLLPGLKIAGKENKLIQHAYQWNLANKGTKVTSDQIQMMERIVNKIHRNAKEVRQGNWANPSAGGFADALFYSNGRHVVVTQSDGTLITVLKDATGNKHFNNA